MCYFIDLDIKLLKTASFKENFMHIYIGRWFTEHSLSMFLLQHQIIASQQFFSVWKCYALIGRPRQIFLNTAFWRPKFFTPGETKWVLWLWLSCLYDHLEIAHYCLVFIILARYILHIQQPIFAQEQFNTTESPLISTNTATFYPFV